MPPITILPAIDLKDGRCVRLRQGRATDARVYSDDPPAMARQWEREGAECLHVVDLDGAFQGRPVHVEIIRAIVAAIRIPVEIGGGLRTDDDIRALLDAGVSRVILGTRACEKTADLKTLVERFGAKLAVGIDARDGLVQVKGWVETSGTRAVELAKQIAGAGVETLIYTDTATDGMLGGPNLESIRAVCEAVSCRVIASGGVSSAEDVRRICALRAPNLAGIIVGKALYEGRMTITDLKAATR